MIEAAVLIDLNCQPLFWHLPDNRTSVSIPDNADFWDVIWKFRDRIAGVAHSHPGNGVPSPSHEDVTTFSAIERGLGRKLTWWIVSADEAVYVISDNNDSYKCISFKEASIAEPKWTTELRTFSGYGA